MLSASIHNVQISIQSTSSPQIILQQIMHKSEQFAKLLKQEEGYLDDSISEQQQHVYQNCGFLITTWECWGQIPSLSMNTAFAVSKNVIVTATVNIFSRSSNRFADAFYYYPNIDYPTRYCSKSYSNRSSEFFSFLSCLNTTHVIRANLKSTAQNLCLLLLNQEIQRDNFLKIGSIPPQYPLQRSCIQLTGYLSPLNCTITEKLLETINGRRAHSTCQIIKVESNTIEYVYGGGLGMAGSPILMESEKGQLMAVGVNTNYYPNNYSSEGIYFSQQVIGIIKKLQKKLLQPYSIEPSIQIQSHSLQPAHILLQYSSNLLPNYLPQKEDDEEASLSSYSSNSSMEDLFQMFDHFTIQKSSPSD